MVRSIEQEIRDLHELFGSSRDPEGLAFVPLADAYRRSGDTTRALVLLTDGRARHPDLPAASLVEGLVRRDLGDAEGAEEAFRRVLELDPDNARALVGLGRVLTGRRAGDPEGEAVLRRGLALDPGLEEEARTPGPAPAAAADDGVVTPADLAPAIAGGEVPGDEGPRPDEGWAEDFGSLEEFPPMDDVDGGPAAVEEEAGIDFDVPASSEEPGRPAEDLHIQWDAEAAFEPFEGGLYGGVETFGDAAPGDETDPPEAEAPDVDAPFDAPEAQEEPSAADGIASWDEAAGWTELEGAIPEAAEAAPPEVGSLPTGDLAPEELLMELSDLAPDLEPGAPPSEEEDDHEEVLPTRTLAELYLRQGLVSEAVQVYEELLERSPDDWALQSRLEELRREGGGGGRAAAEKGTPAEGPPVREFLTRLLAWQPADGPTGPDVG